MVVASLVLLARQTIAAAAAMDAWGLCTRGLARLLGRDDLGKEQQVGAAAAPYVHE
jgi:hypothetical protein